MPGLEQALVALFPSFRLEGTPWGGLWEQRDRESTIKVTRAALLIAAAAYPLHYVLVDRALGLGADPRWLWYRLGVAALALIGAGAASPNLVGGSHVYRLPLAAVGGVACVAQAWSMTWYDKVPYLYAFALPLVSALLLRTSPLKTAAWLIAVHGLQIPAFQRVAVAPQLLWSAFIVSFVVAMMLRSRMSVEIGSFLSEQEKLQAQRKLIESEIELNREVRAFLPREVYQRMETEMRTHRKTVLQAMDEALRPRIRTVACVFSDIRGFTQKSKDLNGFLAHGAVPNIRECTEIVEARGGIPRLIGDLIFAYFDGPSAEANLKNALESGFQLAAKTTTWNSSQPEQNRVQRYVLVSFGQALVGNIGGHDSSREITAMGSPVNMLSRVDPLTKDPSLQPLLSPQALILTRAAAEAARFCYPELDLQKLDLRALGLQIRDFPEEDTLWLAPPPTGSYPELHVSPPNPAARLSPEVQ